MSGMCGAGRSQRNQAYVRDGKLWVRCVIAKEHVQTLEIMAEKRGVSEYVMAEVILAEVLRRNRWLKA